MVSGTVSKTPANSAVMWVNGELVGKSFKAMMALHRTPNQQYEARPLFLDLPPVPLHTTNDKVAHRRCEQLYDMMRTNLEESAVAANAGFLLSGNE